MPLTPVLQSVLLSLACVLYFLHHRGQPQMIALYLLAIVTITGAWQVRNEIAHIWRQHRPLVGLLSAFATGVALLHAVAGGGTAALHTAAKSLTWLTFLLALAAVTHDPRKLRWILAVLFASAFTSAVLSLLLDVTLVDYHPLVEDRLYAIGHVSNPVAIGLSYGWVFIIAAMVLARRPGRNVTVALVVLMGTLATALFRTQSFGAALGLIAATGAALTLHLPTLLRTRLLLSLGGLLAVTLALMSGGIVDLTRLTEVLPRGASFRPEIWQAAIAEASSAGRLFGVGPGSSGDLHLAYDFEHAHSVYVATYYYTGLVGLALLLAIIGVAFRAAVIRRPDLAVMMLYGLTALGFDGDRAIGNLSFTWLLLWVPVGILMSERRDQERRAIVR